MDLLTINKKDPNEDEDKGPSVDSKNIEERIQARRIRIKKKKELSQKFAFIFISKKQIKNLIFNKTLRKSKSSLDLEDIEKKKELTKGRKQIQDSRARLVKLEKDGFELVRYAF